MEMSTKMRKLTMTMTMMKYREYEKKKNLSNECCCVIPINAMMKKISQGSQYNKNAQFNWTETARAMSPAMLQESANQFMVSFKGAADINVM